MKLSVASCFLVGLSVSSAFVVQPPTAGRVAFTELSASRSAAKKASRTKWLATRGFDGSAAAIETENASAGLMKNDMGLEYVKLSDGSSSADVYLYGGVVTSYKDAEGTEFIAVRPDAKMDGSKPISGGLSHCWPQVRSIFRGLQPIGGKMSFVSLF
jgi:glucose-6-phosphate 1-epimerase